MANDPASGASSYYGRCNQARRITIRTPRQAHTHYWAALFSVVDDEHAVGRREPLAIIARYRVSTFCSSQVLWLPASGHTWFFTAGPSRKCPAGGNSINAKKVNDRFAAVLTRLGLPAGREAGFVVHSLRHFFETFTVNAGIPQRAVDAWMGHNSDRSMAAVYYQLNDADSQRFMLAVPFGGVAGCETRMPGGVRPHEQ